MSDLSGQASKPAFLMDAYAAMLRIRLVEEEISRRYQEKEMRNPVHLCIGQEATAVGVSSALVAFDLVMSGHRSHAHYLAKGGSLKRMVAELYGRATGCCRGRGGSQHLIDKSAGFVGAAPILATTVPIATGVAWAAKRRGENQVVVAYFGDGAMEEGYVHEAMSFASLHSLPIIFVCENNGLSTHTLIEERQPDRPISRVADAHAMASAQVDGMNVESVAATAIEAVGRAREGRGPYLIESLTYRFVGHVGPGQEINMGYRTEADLAKWSDPLELAAARLARFPYDWESWSAELRATLDAEIQEAFEYARSSPYPDPSELTADTYPESATHA